MKLKKIFKTKEDEQLLLTRIVLFLLFLNTLTLYYKYHYTLYPLILIDTLGIFFLFYGIYASIKKQVKFKDIKWIFLILVIFLILDKIFVFTAASKHGLSPGVDIILTFGTEIFGKIFLYFQAIVPFIVILFILMGTYKLMGKYHVYPWVLILFMWALSGMKLFFRYII